MAAPIPCLGYRSRTAAALALRAEGNTNAQIAAEMGISLNHLTGLLASADRQLKRTVVLDARALDQLRPHAKARGMGEKELAKRLIAVIAADSMVDAILDDMGPD